MQEDFIHYLWKHKKFRFTNLQTTAGKSVEVLSSGQHNQDSGPDFFNAQLRIDGQLWAGNVEMHLASSDWYAHNHETDKTYDNVILHVVWEHDTEVFRKDNTEIDTVELKHYVSKDALISYRELFSKKGKWINCENEFSQLDHFLLSSWLERLYFERLERKSDDIHKLLKNSKNDWEAVLFKMLAKTFGLKVNGDAFSSMANALDFAIVRKECHDSMNLEALLFGKSGLLDKEIEDAYFKELKNRYDYQKHKYALDTTAVTPIQFFRLRPPNFPTIRLSQLASLYHENHNLFSEVIAAATQEDIYGIFKVSTSGYWETHYTFGKTSRKTAKHTTKAFMDLLLINTIIPLKFSYAKHMGKTIDDEIIQWMSQLKSEKNSIVDKFNTLRQVSSNALHSQSLIQLKANYCDKNKCLQCAIGNSILTN